MESCKERERNNIDENIFKIGMHFLQKFQNLYNQSPSVLSLSLSMYSASSIRYLSRDCTVKPRCCTNFPAGDRRAPRDSFSSSLLASSPSLA